jgi:hypothetical protein
MRCLLFFHRENGAERMLQAGRRGADDTKATLTIRNHEEFRMATQQFNSPFGYEGLTAIAGRLSRHSDDIVNVARLDIADDLRMAARMAHRFASLKFRVLEVAEAALHQDGAAIHRDLKDAVADSERDA